MKISLALLIAILILYIVHYHGPDTTNVRSYQPQNQVQKKVQDESTCTYSTCESLTGGIVGDTLAIQFMFGD